MIGMILKMSAVTGVNILLTYLLWRFVQGKKMTFRLRILLGLIYGGCAVLSTHFGVNYNTMILNVRDLSPLTAGLFFDPLSGVIAGFIGGIERYIAGTYYGVGSYTRIACSVSTCLSGLLAALLNIYVFKKKKPSAAYSYFLGSTMEVFHMYVVLITHRSDMNMAYYVVKICAGPMIIFTGIGLAMISLMIRILSGESNQPIYSKNKENIPVSQRFQFWLFVVTSFILIFNLLFGYIIQTQTAVQNSKEVLAASIKNINGNYGRINGTVVDINDPTIKVGSSGKYEIYTEDSEIVYGDHVGDRIDEDIIARSKETLSGEIFTANVLGTESLCMTRELYDGNTILVSMPLEEVYEDRDHKTYETIMADILLFTVIYLLISMLVQKIVVGNIQLVNKSLNKITNGNLDEEVSVYSSSEFASLSDDINHTVTVLKSYIEAAEHRIEQELVFAKSIQESALPHNFTFPRNDFELYAAMDPAKEVGGDFYDFFLLDSNKLCLVIADVSGKGIPAALFMMRSKTAIRSFAETGITPGVIFEKANNTLCEGNDANMFVTVWMGILNLDTGHMICANAGHEFPILRRNGGDYEFYKQKHNIALGVMEGTHYREYELDIAPGDRLLVYTDGIPEAINESEKDYGLDRLLDVINENKDSSQKELIKYIRQDIWAFVGTADQFDDVTMLGLRYIGKGTDL